jgi:prolipoprotein diacylglyceryltransferase
VWKGGLSIWGGIALGTAFMDVAAPGLLIAQAIGRVGNYFNQELFGRPTDLPWALEIDAAHRPAGYDHFATFHPTFLYELLANLALAAALLLLLQRGRVRPPGIFALYVTGYSGFRILEETLRIDPSHHILGLRLNFFVATTLFLAGAAWFGWTQRGGQALRRGVTLIAIGTTAAAMGACNHAPSSQATSWNRTLEQRLTRDPVSRGADDIRRLTPKPRWRGAFGAVGDGAVTVIVGG